jgi:hypothetical protein
MPNYVTPRLESDVVVSGTTPELTKEDGSFVFLSIPNWPNKAIIDRISIMALTDGITGTMNIKILSDPAAYRALNAPDNERYVLAAWDTEDGAAGPNTSWKLDERYVDGILIQDDTLSNCFHIYLEPEGDGMTDDSQYEVKVYGRPLFDMENYFNRQHIYDEVYWRGDTVSNEWKDLTLQSRNANNIKMSSKKFNLITLASTDQYFYVGALNKFTRVSFDVADENSTEVSLIAEYYDISGNWTQLSSLYDCTDSQINGDDYPFSHSGIVYWTMPTNWSATQLPSTDALPPDALWQFGETVPRYYVRFGLSDISTNPTFYSVRIQPEILSNRR